LCMYAALVQILLPPLLLLVLQLLLLLCAGACDGLVHTLCWCVYGVCCSVGNFKLG
jgi:hypothetical protein